jgi:hypothetical protein
MTGYVIILAALQLAVPVRCYQTDQASATNSATYGRTRTGAR